MPRTLQRSICAMAVFATLGACSADLPKSRDVRDFRVLAIQAEPPEIMVDVDTSIQVQFSALVVDPRQAPLDANPVNFTWSFCPIESDQACVDYNQRKASASDDNQVLLDRMRAISASGSAAQVPQVLGMTQTQAAARAMWPYAITPYNLSVTAADTDALTRYFIDYNGLGLGQGSLPSVVLELGTSDDAIRAMKRFVLGVHDVGAAAAQFQVDLGFKVCAANQDASDGCVPIRPQGRNTNPTIDHIEFSWGTYPGGPFSPAPTPLTMYRGEAIRILPVMTDDSYETFQVLTSDAATGAIGVRDQTEEISISWFANAGDLQNGLTTPLYTRELDNVFAATTDIPPEGRHVTIYMVARDQRGGESWTNFEIEVVP